MIESRIQDHCKTADDVRRAAQAVHERRRKTWHQYRIKPQIIAKKPKNEPKQEEIKPDHPLSRLVDQAAAFMIAENPEPTIKEIQKTVCWIWGVDLRNMLSARRNHRICTPRHIAMLLTKLLKSTSLPKIGYNFGGRDHTTVLHAVKKYDWISERLRNEGLYGKSLGHLAARAKELLENKPIMEPAK